VAEFLVKVQWLAILIVIVARPRGIAMREPVGVSVRPMQEEDVPAARAIFQLAFGTFIGVPDPHTFWADRDYVGTRWRADPSACIVAEVRGSVVGSNFATNWGSLAFFGPLTIHPKRWNQGIAQQLLGPTMALFDRWEVRHAGLFTFAQSAKHVNLYQKFGFWPRFLTAIMSKAPSAGTADGWSAFSAAGGGERTRALEACRALTESLLEGLDVGREVRAIDEQQLGETVLLWDGDVLEAFAACHCGRGTEAGDNTCYIKFAAVRPSPNADRMFDRLLEACESLAAHRGLGRLEAGVNMGRAEAYRRMLSRGFRTDIQGVAMHKPDESAYNRPNVYLIDDWR
jgi:GNAT superfamily N-acetyltransferase